MTITMLAALLAITAAPVDEIRTTFVPEGVTAKVGGYRPVRAKLAEEGKNIQTPPGELTSPEFGTLEFDGKQFGVIIDHPEGEEARLYVDTNADGDFTNDPEARWSTRESGELTQYEGTGQVQLGPDQLGRVNFYRFDPEDPRRQSLKDVLMYYSDFGYEYALELDGETFETSVSGTPSPSTTLWLDRDNNGKRSYHYETVTPGEPFNFTGSTYVLNAADGDLKLQSADIELPQKPLPPDLSVGKPALTFTATTMDGTEIDFPKSYAGKLVMLDFWATWCGPCVAEIPNMKQAYADWHDQGFEILGISFDRAEKADDVTEFTEEREMPWPQIYEGKYWETSLGIQHDVSGIPFVLLVDGDTGEILATARQLRGEGLSEFIGEKLEEKQGEQ